MSKKITKNKLKAMVSKAKKLSKKSEKDLFILLGKELEKTKSNTK